MKKIIILFILCQPIAIQAQSLPTASSAVSAMELANGYFSALYPDPGAPVTTSGTVRPSNYWFRAVYFEGLMGLYGVDPQSNFLSYAVTWGAANHWGLVGGNSDRNANDQCAGQTYIDLYNLNPTASYIQNIQTDLDNILASSAPVTDWWWIDAVHMAMPVWAKLGALTGNSSYFNEMFKFYLNTRDAQGKAGLFNPVDSLWWRDSTFVNPPYVEPNGKSCYWSRGNGWVYSALVRTLDILPPSDPHFNLYLSDFQAMSAALLKVQRSDGFWNVSLFDPTDYGGPETSGTALFVYGMAWGVRKGYLPAATYESSVILGWNAMVSGALHTNGFLGYCQGSGDQPSSGQPISYNSVPNFQDIGTGCFLLAGSEMVRLIQSGIPVLTPTKTPTLSSTPTSIFTATRTNTPVPPTETFTAIHTNTPVPPTPTVTNTLTFTATNTHSPIPPTSTNTAQPPTATYTLAPPTETRTETPVPPTATNTLVASTFTATAMLPTSTNSPVPQTQTYTFTGTVTNTPIPPTATRTNTAVPATATNSPVPPTATHTPVLPTSTDTLVPTSTPTFTLSPTSSGPAALTLAFLAGMTTDSTNSPHPQIEVVNAGTSPLNLNNVEVRYWLNCDCTTQSIQTWVDWAGLEPTGITATTDVMTTAVPTSEGGQTDYVSYKFTGNLVLQPGQSIQIQSRFNKSDWSNMLQDNDWSFAPYTSFTPWTQITGYVNGSLVWGQEPVAVATALKTASVVSYPNPSTGNGVNLSVNLTGSGSPGASTRAKAQLVSGSSTETGIDPNALVTLKVYTITGRLIWSTTVTGASTGSSGNHNIYWNEKDLKGSNLANGLYVVVATVKSQGQTSMTTSKLLILK